MLNHKVRLTILALIVFSLATALGLACPPGDQPVTPPSEPVDQPRTPDPTGPSITPDPAPNNPIDVGPKIPPGGGGPTGGTPTPPDTSRLADINANIQRLTNALNAQTAEVARTSKASTDASRKLYEVDKVMDNAYNKWTSKQNEYNDARSQLYAAQTTLEKDQAHHILTVEQYEKVLNKIRELEPKEEKLLGELRVATKEYEKATSDRSKAFVAASDTQNASIAAQAKQQEIANNLRGWQATRDFILGRVRDFK